MTDKEIEAKIFEFFEDNYELLRYDSGHQLTNDSRQQALEQVLMYWRKSKNIATSITNTEVKLALPDQQSPAKRPFTIEGVVDIVKEEGETWMYDIKTHDLGYIQKNKHLYEQQLSIYAHIWQNLRGQPLDHTAIISTSIPTELRDALRNPDPRAQEKAMNEWEPVVEIEKEQERIDELILEFGKTVDKIEEHEFAPPSPTKLNEKMGSKMSRGTFATRVCGNCDARFSCTSYREYAAKRSGQHMYHFKKFYIDPAPDAEQEEWMAANFDLGKLEQALNVTND